jgi:hypothetical protein
MNLGGRQLGREEGHDNTNRAEKGGAQNIARERERSP